MEKNRSNPKGRRKNALGKGLSALLPETSLVCEERDSDNYFQCDVNLIFPNRYQPRMKFSEDELAELSQSIEEQGIIQPLIVRRGETGYELIAGERRLRASKMAGLERVPVVIKEITDHQLLEMAIVENIQRENFNPIEEADAYNRLMKEYECTQEQVALRVGKSRSAVANFLRLRQLPDPIKESINENEISMGHARALLGAGNDSQQTAAWKTVVTKGLSVRETENLVKRLKAHQEESPEPLPPSSEELYIEGLAEKLSAQLGTKVKIKRRGEKGKVEIDFYNDGDLDRLLNLFQMES